MNHYLAIDIGASSDRHIVGWKEEGLSCSSWRFMDTMSFLEYLLRYEWNKGRSIHNTFSAGLLHGCLDIPPCVCSPLSSK